MALVQTVMWTAVPNGIDTATGKLKVRCLVSPRLSSIPEANQTLGVYADWPQWTTKVAAAGFTLSIQVGGVTHANLVPGQDGFEAQPVAGAVPGEHAGAAVQGGRPHDQEDPVVPGEECRGRHQDALRRAWPTSGPRIRARSGGTWLEKRARSATSSCRATTSGRS